jgi:hypothetical protein
MGKHVLRLALVVLLCVLLGTVVSAQGSAPAAPTAAAAYVVQAGTVSGAGYRLSGGTWQVEGSAGGSGYTLEAMGKGIMQGAGCCCTFLPCVMRND